MFGWFTTAKNAIMAIIAMAVGGYVLKQKYDAYQAESKLEKLEGQIAKTNVKVAKEVAKAKATAKEIEHSTHIEVLKELKVERAKTLQEMDDLEQTIEDKFKENEKVTGRRRGKAFKVSN